MWNRIGTHTGGLGGRGEWSGSQVRCPAVARAHTSNHQQHSERKADNSWVGPPGRACPSALVLPHCLCHSHADTIHLQALYNSMHAYLMAEMNTFSFLSDCLSTPKETQPQHSEMCILFSLTRLKQGSPTPRP